SPSVPHPYLHAALPILPTRERPFSDHEPPSGRSNPLSRLNRVVLPAPFGPMRAVMAWRGTSRCSTSTALTPPKARLMLSATRIRSEEHTSELQSRYDLI